MYVLYIVREISILTYFFFLNRIHQNMRIKKYNLYFFTIGLGTVSKIFEFSGWRENLVSIFFYYNKTKNKEYFFINCKLPKKGSFEHLLTIEKILMIHNL